MELSGAGHQYRLLVGFRNDRAKTSIGVPLNRLLRLPDLTDEPETISDVRR
jgi:hypothetical protein